MSRSLLQETIAAISALVGTVALSAACGSDDAPAEGSPDAGANGGTSGVGATGGSGGTSGTAASDAPLPLPSFDSLPPGWSTLKPGGETLCAHGSAFQFFVRPGTVNRVLIEFSGTGACWDENS